jgi:hypothetical protein
VKRWPSAPHLLGVYSSICGDCLSDLSRVPSILQSGGQVLERTRSDPHRPAIYLKYLEVSACLDSQTSASGATQDGARVETSCAACFSMTSGRFRRLSFDTYVQPGSRFGSDLRRLTKIAVCANVLLSLPERQGNVRCPYCSCLRNLGVGECAQLCMQYHPWIDVLRAQNSLQTAPEGIT